MSDDSDSRKENLAEVRKARVTAAVRAIQAESVRRGLDKMTMEEIDEIIQKVRKARSR